MSEKYPLSGRPSQEEVGGGGSGSDFESDWRNINSKVFAFLSLGTKLFEGGVTLWATDQNFMDEFGILKSIIITLVSAGAFLGNLGVDLRVAKLHSGEGDESVGSGNVYQDI